MAKAGIRSRSALADILGYSRTQLHAVETGKVEPTAKFLERLQEEEAKVGLASNSTAQTTAHSVQLAAFRSDAEITGLAALLNLHAARVHSGEMTGDLPEVRNALERALAGRGALPPTD